MAQQGCACDRILPNVAVLKAGRSALKAQLLRTGNPGSSVLFFRRKSKNLDFAQPSANKGDTDEAISVLAACLAFLQREEPEIAVLMEAWPRLPEAVKAGIKAMVIATTSALQE